MARPIYSITPFTLLDYPDRTACILWFAGCNMRCVYCYNPDIVLGKGKLSFDDALAFLDRRGALLDGVVLSGGECTAHHNLEPFLKSLKHRGYQVKVDTNGTAPLLLEHLIQSELIDDIALDFKALPKSFESITGSRHFDTFQRTLDILLRLGTRFEVRTTVHSALISPGDLREMAVYLYDKGYRGKYFIQHFVNGSSTLEPLPYSTKIEEDFSSSEIQVIFRG